MKKRDINLDQKDIDLFKYLSKNKLIKLSDIKYIYKMNYPDRRIRKLIKNHYIVSNVGYGKLTTYGINMIKEKFNIDSHSISRSKKYVKRLKLISKYSIEFYKNNIEFNPSWILKKEYHTLWSRRYIGEVVLDNMKYIVYLLPENSRMLRNVLFDVNRDFRYKNIIVFIDYFNNFNDTDIFLFPNKENRIIMLISQIKILALESKINKDSIIYQIYNKNCSEGDYNFVDGKINNRNIVFMPLINIDKISAINSSLDNFDLLTLHENTEVVRRLLNDYAKENTNIIEIGEYINE